MAILPFSLYNFSSVKDVIFSFAKKKKKKKKKFFNCNS